ncbi:prolyl 4-hydroxylase subunit alpha-2-like [Paramisgurnus dabryanus]|uniref:prolyl 4-hydroxylase subunit alpha-2-like n=1 Tax=Paramisgurnus dabryanus TaxID=90735 RepID=UPI0031F3474C
MKELLSVVTFVWIVSVAGHEFFSSMDQIMQLVEEEKKLLEHFSDFMDSEEENFNILKGYLQNSKLLSNSTNPEKIMNDPVAAYKLIRRLRNQWLLMEEYTQRSLNEDFKELLHSDLLKIPTQEDLDGAALGLIRLQEIYKLYPHNITYKTPLSGDEAFDVGYVAYKHEKFQLAFHWFQYSLNVLGHPDLLYYLGSSAYKYGDRLVAIDFYLQFLDHVPTNEYVKNELEEIYSSFYIDRYSDPDIYILNTESTEYEGLCRGEVDQRTYRRQRTLSCRYSTGGGNPRLILAPLKEEIEWDEPRIIRYHDIISDKEIEILKNISRPQLSRSKVYIAQDEEGAVINNRVSQSVFLEEDDTVTVRINQRIADVTGLSMEKSETLVQNYGIGGRYEPHHDFLDIENDRIATFLIYMSDVEKGGATVFPDVGVAVQPIKGSAVFWYNLHKNGTADLKTLHGGCPIIVGNKWVANKWIHEFGQEFTRPCSLSDGK